MPQKMEINHLYKHCSSKEIKAIKNCIPVARALDISLEELIAIIQQMSIDIKRNSK